MRHALFVILCFAVHICCAQWHEEPKTDSVVIGQHVFVGTIDTNGFHLLNGHGDTLVKMAGEFSTLWFKDFDKDGYKDIMLFYKSGQGDNVFELFLYRQDSGGFKMVTDFSNYPRATQVPGTCYYYSYYHYGCADLNWGSDLIYLKDCVAVKTAHIDGVGCDNGDKDVKNGIFVYKAADSEHPIQTLPIGTIERYKAYKWGFLDAYWRKNYRLFPVSGVPQ